jgi:D-ribose pyranose/furanose isomerase RbsD
MAPVIAPIPASWPLLLDNHEDIHDHKQDDERKVLQHLDGIRKVNEIRAIGHEEVAENAHRRCCYYLVE